MLATLFAALGQEFAETTPENVEQGKQSISLIFNDKNKDMRLVGVLNPLRASDIPQDSFEAAALAYAMHGQHFTDVQRVDDKWYYRRSYALSNFHAVLRALSRQLRSEERREVGRCTHAPRAHRESRQLEDPRPGV